MPLSLFKNTQVQQWNDMIDINIKVYISLIIQYKKFIIFMNHKFDFIIFIFAI